MMVCFESNNCFFFGKKESNFLVEKVEMVKGQEEGSRKSEEGQSSLYEAQLKLHRTLGIAELHTKLKVTCFIHYSYFLLPTVFFFSFSFWVCFDR